jgi:hypothetical protein
MALGMVLTPAPLTTRGPCLNCGLDAEGCTVETWKMWGDPGDTYPMCFWCLELPKRRQKGSGGLYQRHDHPTCPPLEVIGYTDEGKPIEERAEHKCRGRWVGTVEVNVDGTAAAKSCTGAPRRKPA